MPKEIQKFKAWFWRKPADAKEVGPQNEFREVEATSMTGAVRIAKRMAKNLGWRFNEILDGDTGPSMQVDVEKLINQ